ncbi:AAA family ATPase [Andreprevotia chitinilytica]|uniref:AAA family ATPase n=1 Tax=Andreprevotia chitinilytica TaxID=396808 RepID=UPI000555E311|nr:AAA family ATPase [Andreprevotia chitinilytica]
MPRHINPDDYLLTPTGRIWSAERGKAAWESAYAALEAELQSIGSPATLYVVCGIQGAGKSTWIREEGSLLPAPAVFFDAALPAKIHRERAISIARRFGIPVTIIWLNTPLDTALARNQSRPADEQVPEETIRLVHAKLEPPALDEGVARVIEVHAHWNAPVGI